MIDYDYDNDNDYDIVFGVKPNASCSLNSYLVLRCVFY